MKTVLLLFFAAVAAQAQILAPGGRTLFARRALFRTFTLLERDNTGATKLVTPLALVYGLPRNLQFTAVAPVVHVPDNTGFADPLFLVKYDGLLKRNRVDGLTRLAVEFGARPPWGQRPFSTDAIGYVTNLVFQHVAGRRWLVADAQYTANTESDRRLHAGNVLNLDLAPVYRLLPARLGRSEFWDAHNLLAVLEVNAELRDRDRL